MRILAVDDNPIVRAGLRVALGAVAGVQHVSDTDDAAAAVAAVRAGAVDAVLLDVRMPGRSGLDLIADLVPHATVVMLTHDDDAETLAAALAGGAAGYIVHGTMTPREIVSALRDCMAGSTVLRGARSPFRSSFPAPARGPGPHGDVLSPREDEVIRLIAQGRTNGEIARALFVSEKTVKNHVTHIFAKLAVATRAQAVSAWLLADGPSRGMGPR